MRTHEENMEHHHACIRRLTNHRRQLNYQQAKLIAELDANDVYLRGHHDALIKLIRDKA